METIFALMRKSDARIVQLSTEKDELVGARRGMRTPKNFLIVEKEVDDGGISEYDPGAEARAEAKAEAEGR